MLEETHLAGSVCPNAARQVLRRGFGGGGMGIARGLELTFATLGQAKPRRPMLQKPKLAIFRKIPL
jgi:hypothetical protein